MNNIAFSQRAMTDFFRGFCSDKGILVHIKKGLEVPCCDSRGNIYLPVPDLTNPVRFWGAAYHEAGHLDPEVRWTMDFLDDGSINSKAEHMIYNLLIDHLSERNRHGYYRGRDDVIYESHADLFRENPNLLEGIAKVYPVMAGAMMADIGERSMWQGPLPPLELPANAVEFYEAVKGMSLGDTLKNILDTKDKEGLRELVAKILALDPPKNKDGDRGDKSDDGDGDQKGDGEREEGSGEGNEDGSGDGSDQPGTDDSGGSAGESSDDQPGDSDDDSATGDSRKRSDSSDPGDIDDSEGGWGACSSKEEVQAADEAFKEWVNDNQNQDVPPIVEDVYDTDHTYIPMDRVTWHDMTGTLPGSGDTRDREYIKAAHDMSDVSRDIQKYLKTLKITRYAHGKRSGRISVRSLHRVFGSNPTPPAIFKQKQQSSINMDTAVTLLIDQSGSMHGQKFHIAAACGVSLSETLRDLRIQNEILGFTDSDDIEMYLYKRFDEANVPSDTLIERLSVSRIMSCNADGESLLIAAERLLMQPQSNKVLIVLSDGQPAGNGIGNDLWYLKQVCEEIEERSPISLYGIGIKSNDVCSFYKNHCVVHDPKSLDSALLPIMRDNIINNKENN